MRMLELVLCLAIATGAIACNRSEESARTSPPVSAPAPEAAAQVTEIALGNAIGADGRIPSSDQKTTFAPRDTVYVSVVTDKPPAGATLSARWTYEDGQLVSENRESLTSAARNATEFHISKPDGWPPGRYQVEIALNGQPAGSREFEVR